MPAAGRPPPDVRWRPDITIRDCKRRVCGNWTVEFLVKIGEKDHRTAFFGNGENGTSGIHAAARPGCATLARQLKPDGRFRMPGMTCGPVGPNRCSIEAR
jgi:hypothetical protein